MKFNGAHLYNYLILDGLASSCGGGFGATGSAQEGSQKWISKKGR